ncbi:MAG: hypothetical protein H7330_14555 [Hymenobacteraceae bacterium]|nr:hypothetical protein [Hymenobacteraceae bacterium]
MRYLLPALGFVTPSFSARAQTTLEPAVLEHFTTDAGTYLYVSGVQYRGKLRYEPETENVVKLGFRTHVVVWVNGKPEKLYAEDVKSFSLENRFFISTDSEGRGPTGVDSADFEGTFVQLADTGRLELGRRYAGATSGGGYGPVSYTIGHEWLIRQRKGGWTIIPRPALGGYSSKKFRAMLAKYFADRPDLLDSLKNESLTYQDLEQAVHAYNSGEPTFFIE